MTTPSVSEYPPLVELGRTLASFTSVIKSGEPWTATCQRDYDRANLALQALAHLPAGSEAVKPDVMKGYLLAWNAAYAAKDGGNDAVLNAVHAAMPAPPSTPPAANVQDAANRYTMYADATGYQISGTPDSKGEWVKYEDHIALLNQNEAVAIIQDFVRSEDKGTTHFATYDRAVKFLRSKQAPTVAVPDEGLRRLLDVESDFSARLVQAVGPRKPDQDVFARIAELRARAEQRETPGGAVGEEQADRQWCEGAKTARRALDSRVYDFDNWPQARRDDYQNALDQLDKSISDREEAIADSRRSRAAAPTSDGR